MNNITIIALTKYSYNGASSRYRVYNYQKYFAKNNIDMSINPLFSSSYLATKNKIIKSLIVLFSYFKRLFLLVFILFFKNRYKLILIEYELFPYFPAFFEYLLYKRGIKYFVDYDDAIFHKYENYRLLANKIAKVMGYADTVIVCNSYLEDYAKMYNKNIFMIPTVVDLDLYRDTMLGYKKEDSNHFIIGWIGSGSTSVYILEIVEVLESFVARYQNVRVHLVGFDDDLLSLAQKEASHIELIPWAEEREIQDILAFDIGIMPLSDDGWSRGKCAFKLIQYMSCQKAVIASNVGMNTYLVKNDMNGFVVEDKKSWFKALEKLYLDEDKREEMAQNNFKKIEKYYNNKNHAKRYVSLIKNSLNSEG